jgi:hypothetical protein
LSKLDKKIAKLPIGNTADEAKQLSKLIANASEVLRKREKRK